MWDSVAPYCWESKPSKKQGGRASHELYCSVVLAQWYCPCPCAFLPSCVPLWAGKKLFLSCPRELENMEWTPSDKKMHWPHISFPGQMVLYTNIVLAKTDPVYSLSMLSCFDMERNSRAGSSAVPSSFVFEASENCKINLSWYCCGGWCEQANGLTHLSLPCFCKEVRLSC